MKTVSIVFTLVLSLSGAICAQTLGSPSLGVVFDAKTGSVRNLEGVAGAAREGQDINFNVMFGRAFISPSQTYVIAETIGSNAMVLGKNRKILAICNPFSRSPQERQSLHLVRRVSRSLSTIRRAAGSW